MRKWDVFMESFVCIELPDGVDPDLLPGSELLVALATSEYMKRLQAGQCEFTWESYEEV